MVFNGHTTEYIESLDEELFTEIQVMYADGVLGNKAIFDALAPITAAVFNYFRDPKSSAIKTTEIFPWIHEYSIDPSNDIDPATSVSNALIGYVSQAKGFRMDRFANVGS